MERIDIQRRQRGYGGRTQADGGAVGKSEAIEVDVGRNACLPAIGPYLKNDQVIGLYTEGASLHGALAARICHGQIVESRWQTGGNNRNELSSVQPDHTDQRITTQSNLRSFNKVGALDL